MGVVGASGLIGRRLSEVAAEAGWCVVGYSRSRREPGNGVEEWREWSGRPDVSGLDALVNLAGESIAQRWTSRNRQLFHQSRIGVTGILAKAVAKSGSPPSIWVNGSAIGIFGDRGDEWLNESSTIGSGYLAELCRDWERVARVDAEGATRVAFLRTGVVLGPEAEAWRRMRLAFSLGLGGRFGNGQQWMPWIHLGDVVGAILHIVNGKMEGPVNAVAPGVVKNAEFTKQLASFLKRPAICHAPGWALKLALGGFGQALLGGQRAKPAALLESGYSFRYSALSECFADLG